MVKADLPNTAKRQKRSLTGPRKVDIRTKPVQAPEGPLPLGITMTLRFRLRHLMFGIAWVFVAWCASIVILPPLLPASAYTMTPMSIAGEASYSISARTGGLTVSGPARSIVLSCDPSGRSRTCLHRLSENGLAEGQTVSANYVEMRLLWLNAAVLVSIDSDGRTILTCEQTAVRLGWGDAITSKICSPH